MAPGAMLQPQIVLLKEGTDTSQGKAQLISNINACQAVVDVVRTTLGPRGVGRRSGRPSRVDGTPFGWAIITCQEDSALRSACPRSFLLPRAAGDLRAPHCIAGRDAAAEMPRSLSAGLRGPRRCVQRCG